jgi:hypothetical protein
MLGRKHIHGYELDWTKTPSEGRENFLYLKNQEDLLPAVKQQFLNYMQKPQNYNLPKNPTISDAVRVFDQTGAQGKLGFLEQLGIDTSKLLSEIF